MKNNFIKLPVVLLFSLLLLPTLSNASSISISARYSEAANTFLIMDCLSGWWDRTFCQDKGGGVQEYWTKKFGLIAEDQILFKKYDDIRKRYYKGLGVAKDDIGPYADGLFAKKSGITEDLLAPLFYSSNNLQEALAKVKKLVSDDDFIFLQSFYEHYKTKYQVLLDESTPFKKKVQELNKKLQNKKYNKFFSQIANYYQVSENMKYEVLYTWFPPLESDSASPTNNFLIFQQNPIKHINSKDEDIIFHEIIHTLSARQSQKQKEEISKIFLDACPSVNNKSLAIYGGRILEEPMAVTIGQILFLKKFFPERLKWNSQLYNNPWISSFAKLINPIIEKELDQKLYFSVETGKKLGFLCNELFSAANFMNAQPNK